MANNSKESLIQGDGRNLFKHSQYDNMDMDLLSYDGQDMSELIIRATFWKQIPMVGDFFTSKSPDFRFANFTLGYKITEIIKQKDSKKSGEVKRVGTDRFKSHDEDGKEITVSRPKYEVQSTVYKDAYIEFKAVCVHVLDGEGVPTGETIDGKEFEWRL